jgi:hypothetical protein
MRNVIIGGILLLGGSIAHAGFKQDQPVVLSANTFSGQIGSARAATDSNEYIGCYIHSFVKQPAMAVCFATDASGAHKMCVSSDPAVVQAVTAMTSSSYISVYFDNDANCGEILVSTNSWLRPATP